MENNNLLVNKITLKGSECIALWLKGKDAWNQWVEENPIANVSFALVIFEDELKKVGLNRISFSGYHFPEGDVNFNNAEFGKGNVNFSDTKFGKGNVNFSCTKFGEGTVAFFNADFGEGDVNFHNAEFGKGSVHFNHAEFSKGDVTFFSAEFGEGEVCFSSTNFGRGNVNFRHAIFGKGDVNFGHAKFGKGNVDFFSSEFGEGAINFSGINFGEGLVNFTRADFIDHVNFRRLKEPNKITNFSFQKAAFNKTIDISQNTFKCVVDFTNTAINHQLTLDDMTCDWGKGNTKKYGCNWVKASYAEDIPRLRRLKEIAEDNKDHELALEFNAQEMKAKRWHNNNGIFYTLSDGGYRFFSDYGRSVFRPFISLFVSFLFFSGVYLGLSNSVETVTFANFGEKLPDALSFSGAQILPFVPSSRLATQEGVKVLFGNNFSSGVYCAAIIQGILSFGLLFLLGLALRNRFRL